jgi:antitoxin HicB
MVGYDARFEPDPSAGGFVVTFPDFGYGVTQGEDLEDSRAMAEELLACLVREAILQGVALPAPKKRPGRRFRRISLPALQSAKVELYNTFRASGMSKAELARRIGIAKTNIDRLFDLNHASRLEQMEAALGALGKKLDLVVADAA